MQESLLEKRKKKGRKEKRNESHAGHVKERVFFDTSSSLLCKHFEYHD